MRPVRAAIGIALVVGVAGCGGAHQAAAPHRSTASRSGAALIGGVPLQQARCAQWRAGSFAQKQAVVRALAGIVGGPSGTARGTTLSQSEAFSLFDRACATRVARYFLLYELYTRAAGFRSLGTPPT